jgi:uncharacterized OB-fold protein
MTKLVRVPVRSPRAVFEFAAKHGAIARRPSHSDAGWLFPPRSAGSSGALDEEPGGWTKTGQIVSATEVFAKTGNFILALVDLDGGGRLLCRLRALPGSTGLIGQPVRLVQDRVAGEPFLTFELIRQEPSA